MIRQRSMSMRLRSTGFFGNDSGDVLSARHVVEGCQSPCVIRGAQIARARVRAVIVCGIKLHLADSFAKTVDVAS
jgi:serine protease Do